MWYDKTNRSMAFQRDKVEKSSGLCPMFLYRIDPEGITVLAEQLAGSRSP